MKANRLLSLLCAGVPALLLLSSAVAFAQEPRRFTRTPYLSGPDDPARGKVRGTIKLGETVIIEIPGGFDSILEPGVVPELRSCRNLTFTIRGLPSERCGEGSNSSARGFADAARG